MKRRTINVINVFSFGDSAVPPRCYSDHFELECRSPQYRIVLHIRWLDFPWLARQLWAAWRQQKKTVEAQLAFQEKALKGEWGD